MRYHDEDPYIARKLKCLWLFWGLGVVASLAAVGLGVEFIRSRIRP